MDGLNVGTLFALLKLDNQMSPELVQASRDVEQFGEVTQNVATQQGTFSQALSTTSDVLPVLEAGTAAAAGRVSQLGVTTTAAGASVATLSTQTSAAATAQRMMAEMVQAANDAYDKANPATLAAAESTALWGVSLETAGIALGNISLAVVAFGPRIWELIGGWEGLKDIMAETGELFADLTNIIEPFTDHVLNSLIQGLTATASVLPTIGGAIVDFVVSASELTGVTLMFERLRDVIGAMAAEGSLEDLVNTLNTIQLPDGFAGGGSLSFGIDPNDTESINAYNREVDTLIAKGDPLRASYTDLQGSINSTSMVFETLTSTQLRSIGTTVELTAAEKRHVEQMREMEVVGEKALEKYANAPVTFDAMREALEALNSPLAISTGFLKEINEDVDFNELRVQLEAFNSPLAISAETLAEMNAAVDFNVMREQLEALEGGTGQWQASVESLAGSLLMLGSIAGGTFGSILGFIGTAINGFFTLKNAIGTIQTSITQIGSGGFTNIISGVTGIVGAVSAALPLVIALGSAIKRAFTSEETELVNPNRDLFTAQFIGAETDPFQAIGNSTIRAAMQVYGVDWDTAWSQYAEPLIRQLQDADTYAEFKTAQLAIGELFRQAGVTLDIFNEAGIATQYRSGVFDTGLSYTVPAGMTQQQIADYGQTFTAQTGTAVMGAYGQPAGATMFQTGTMPSSAAGFCVHVENLYVNGATGQQQAKSFFDALYSYVTGGGDALSKWRDLNCAAGAV